MKKIITISALALCFMAVGLLPMASTTAHAESSGRAIMLDFDGVKPRDTTGIQGDGTGIAYEGDQIVMGEYGNSLVYWVRLNGNGIPLMLSTRSLGTSAFESDGTGFYYESDNELQAAMKNLFDSGVGLSDQEKSLVNSTKIDSYDMYSGPGATDLENQRFFPLSSSDILKVGEKSQMAKDESVAFWWLCYVSSGSFADTVEGDTGGRRSKSVSVQGGVRPAFYLNEYSVLFTSAAEGGKVSTVGDAPTAISSLAPTTWKVTLKSNRYSFNVTGTPIVTDSEITFNYTGATTGVNEHISVMLAMQAAPDDITHYAKVEDLSSSADGSASFPIPNDIAGNVTLRIFNEQTNGDNKTDYSSSFKEFNLSIPAAVSYNLTHLSSSNSVTKHTATNDYATTLTADTGYVLPNAITITVGGAPLTLDTDGTLISGEYSYDSTTGNVVIHKDSITGAIAITANALEVNNLQSVTQADITYGTAANPMIAYSGGATATNGGAVVLEYKLQTEADTAYTTTVPQYVGNYTVRATSAATATVAAGEKADDFSITAANQTPTISTNGVVLTNDIIDLSTLVTNAEGTVNFALSSSGGSLSGANFTAPNTAGTATFTVSITTADLNSDGNNEYNAYTGGTLNVNVVELSIIKGANQKIRHGQSASFTSNDDFSNYQSLELTLSGGTSQVLHRTGDPNNQDVTIEAGSIVATLSESYTATLPVGTHTLSIISTTGAATTNFTVAAPTPTPTPAPTPTPTTNISTDTSSTHSPHTGDNTNTPLFFTLMIVSALGLMTLFLTRKKWLPVKKK